MDVHICQHTKNTKSAKSALPRSAPPLSPAHVLLALQPLPSLPRAYAAEERGLEARLAPAAEGLDRQRRRKKHLHRVYWHGWALWWDCMCAMTMPGLFYIG